jgi:hypothetical protein
MKNEIEEFKKKDFTGRSYRLLEEWEIMFNRFKNHNAIAIVVRERDGNQLPIEYDVFYNIKSFCGVEEKDENGLEKPVFADEFIMRIIIPNSFPSCDERPNFKFLTENIHEQPIPHPWHPNIRFFGDFAGRVCLNNEAFGTYADLALFIERVALYLKYDKYHAVNEVPYPEDEKVAEWVLNQAEPNGWIDELQNIHSLEEKESVSS